jgi:hypothetical protein
MLMSFKAINQIWEARKRAVRRAYEDLSHVAHGRNGFDPNQPRVPAGHSDGGQWSHANGGAGDTSRFVVNSDGSAVLSEVNRSDPSIPWDERHTVRLADGREFTVENLGLTQTVYDGQGVPIKQTIETDNGPELVVIPEFVRGRRVAPPIVWRRRGGGFLEPGTEALLAVFAARSLYNSRNRTAILDFRAEDYIRGGEGAANPAIRVGELTEKEVDAVCRRHKNTQDFLDGAVDEAHKAGDYARGPAVFGTRVHTILRDKIRERARKDRDENYKAEVPIEKVSEADPRLRGKTLSYKENGDDAPRYGGKDTQRLDVMDYDPKTKTMCMPDAKTGKARFEPKRMHQMVLGALVKFPDAERFIIYEMRPTRMPERR